MSENKKPRDFVRVKTGGMIFGYGDRARVEVVRHIEKDGRFEEEVTDISDFVQGMEFPRTKVGELSRVRLDLISVSVESEALLQEVVLRDFPRKRFSRLRRLIDVTTVGQRSRVYTQA